MSSTITTTTSYASAITELLRDRPGHDTPPAERQTWMARKADLLAAVEAAEAAR